MAERDDRLWEVLDGYAKFLEDKNLAIGKHQLHLVRWVREFLLFARAHDRGAVKRLAGTLAAENGF